MSKQSDKEAMTTYSIFRTGDPRKKHYQVNKLVCSVEVDSYWVYLHDNGNVFCNCPGFQRQQFALPDHKHVKIALDFYARGEPDKALYKIQGRGANTKIKYLGEKAL